MLGMNVGIYLAVNIPNLVRVSMEFQVTCPNPTRQMLLLLFFFMTFVCFSTVSLCNSILYFRVSRIISQIIIECL